MPDPRPGGRTHAGSFDRTGHVVAARRAPRPLRSLPGVTRDALRLARSASPRLFHLTIATQFFGAVLLGAQVLLGKLAIEGILDASRTDGSVADPLPALAGLVAAGALGSFANTFQGQAQRLLGEHVRRLTLGQTLAVTTTVELETLESPEFFDDLQRVEANALVQPATLAQGLATIAGGALGALALITALLVIEPLVVPVLLGSALPLWLLSRTTSRMEFDFTVRESPGHRLRLYLVRLLTGRDEAKELRSFGLGPVLRRRWDASYDAYVGALRAHVRRRLLLALAGTLATVVVTTAAFALLVSFVLSDRLSLAEAGAAVIAARLLATRTEQLFRGVAGLFESRLFLEDLRRFLARAPARSEEPGAAVVPVPRIEEVVLDDVHFSYPGSDRAALRGVSLRIARGETVALVGENGSGKTTLATILGTLFTPTRGRVTWNGADVRTLDRQALRQRIGTIFQDFVRYQLTARENIGLGRPERVADTHAIADAARRAGAHDHLASLPDGYDTVLGKEFSSGHDLSIGQWQRVALARAFFREADLLILDEPTASLDARAEHELFEHVRELARGRSLLLISHRFSTVRSVDRIYVLDAGRIVEHGSHDELMTAGGRYAELFNLQATAYR
jgi:ATP-binding cassette subfamily B protein